MVAMFIIRIDIAAVIAFDFRPQFLGKNLIAQSLGGFDFSLGFCKAYAQADFGARLIETAGGHDVSCLKKMADYSGYTDRFILICFAIGQIMSGCWKKASGRLKLMAVSKDGQEYLPGCLKFMTQIKISIQII